MENVSKTSCPKCGFKNDIDAEECLKCGIIFAKYAKKTAKTSTNNCKKCGSPIPKSSKDCPYCGAELHQKPGMERFAKGIFIFIVIIASLWYFVGREDNSPAKNPSEAQIAQKRLPAKKLSEAEKEQRKVQREKERAEEYELCKKDLKCWGNKHSLKATYASQDRIERMAKHDFKWTDGWLGSKMTRYGWKDKSALTLTYKGDQIKFQNGFGAWTNMIYIVDYDPINERLLNVSIREGRLPK